MPLDPQIARHLEELAAAGSFPVAELTPERARLTMRRAYIDDFGEPDAVGSVVDFALPGPGGRLPIRVYTPQGGGTGLPLMVYSHGGGWVVGDLDTHDGLCRALAARSGCIMAAVDYRLGRSIASPRSRRCLGRNRVARRTGPLDRSSSRSHRSFR